MFTHEINEIKCPTKIYDFTVLHFVTKRDGITDGQTDGQMDDPIPRCPRRTCQAEGIKYYIQNVSKFHNHNNHFDYFYDQYL